jgi:hypothetical protein
MPSPFPGMNPYLEHPHTWNDFHQTFLTFLRQTLAASVAPDYYVRIDEHLYVHEHAVDEPRLAGRADLSISRQANGNGNDAASATAVLTPPARGRLIIPDYERQVFLEVRDRRNHEIVTVIELLSPANKNAGKDRNRYLTKRDEVLWSGAHFVEIDLLRGGLRPPIEGLHPCDYYVLVSRVEERPEVALWPVQMREPLPRIPIPLRHPHPDARLDLKPALDQAFDSACYDLVIYDTAPSPPLSPDDAAWAAQFVPVRT